MTTIKEKVEKEYGTINKFIDSVYKKTRLSRTYLYQLIQNKDVNPTMETMMELARITNIALEDITHEYSNRYRDSGTEGERQD